jgi:hypothetical protein
MERRTSATSLSPSVEDNVIVGTPEILQSPHVSEGPGQIAKSPVPSIFLDDRGDIHRLRVGGKRINMLYSKSQVMRSGYLHPHATRDFVVSGQVEVWTLTKTATVKTLYGPNEYFTIPPYVPHILYFLQDSVLVEWWDGEAATFQCWVYHPYRKIIDIQNSLISKGVSRHQRLVPQDDFLNQTSGRCDKEESARRRRGAGVFWWTTGGLLVGLVLGAILGAVVVSSDGVDRPPSLSSSSSTTK